MRETALAAAFYRRGAFTATSWPRTEREASDEGMYTFSVTGRCSGGSKALRTTPKPRVPMSP